MITCMKMFLLAHLYAAWSQEADPGRDAAKLPFSVDLSGFVDVAGHYNAGHPRGGSSALRSYDVKADSFFLQRGSPGAVR